MDRKGAAELFLPALRSRRAAAEFGSRGPAASEAPTRGGRQPRAARGGGEEGVPGLRAHRDREADNSRMDPNDDKVICRIASRCRNLGPRTDLCV